MALEFHALDEILTFCLSGVKMVMAVIYQGAIYPLKNKLTISRELPHVI